MIFVVCCIIMVLHLGKVHNMWGIGKLHMLPEKLKGCARIFWSYYDTNMDEQLHFTMDKNVKVCTDEKNLSIELHPKNDSPT